MEPDERAKRVENIFEETKDKWEETRRQDERLRRILQEAGSEMDDISAKGLADFYRDNIVPYHKMMETDEAELARRKEEFWTGFRILFSEIISEEDAKVLMKGNLNNNMDYLKTIEENIHDEGAKREFHKLNTEIYFAKFLNYGRTRSL